MVLRPRIVVPSNACRTAIREATPITIAKNQTMRLPLVRSTPASGARKKRAMASTVTARPRNATTGGTALTRAEIPARARKVASSGSGQPVSARRARPSCRARRKIAGPTTTSSISPNAEDRAVRLEGTIRSRSVRSKSGPTSSAASPARG